MRPDILPVWEIWNTIFYGIIIPLYSWFFITGSSQVLPGPNCSIRTRFVSLGCIYLQCEPFYQSQSPSVPFMSLPSFKTEFICLILDVYYRASWITTYKCPFLPFGYKKPLQLAQLQTSALLLISLVAAVSNNCHSNGLRGHVPKYSMALIKSCRRPASVTQQRFEWCRNTMTFWRM